MNYEILDGEYEKLVPFFVANDLEFDGDEEVDTSIIKTYKIENEEGDLIAGAVLAQREGEYIVDGIAVAQDYRNERIGEAILGRLLEEAEDIGAERVYLVARAPGFFRTQGFEETDPDDAPNFFECKTCPQYGEDCHPEIMMIELI